MGFGQHNVRSAAGISASDGLLEVLDRRVGIICVQRELSRVKMIFGCIGSRCRTARQHPFDASALHRFILQAEADLKPELAQQEFVVRGGGSRLSSSQLRLCRFEILRLDGFLKIGRSEEHTSELQSLMRISYAVFCFKKKTNTEHTLT